MLESFDSIPQFLSLCPFSLQFFYLSFRWVNSTNLLSSLFVHYFAITPIQCFGFCVFIHEEECIFSSKFTWFFLVFSYYFSAEIYSFIFHYWHSFLCLISLIVIANLKSFSENFNINYHFGISSS